MRTPPIPICLSIAAAFLLAVLLPIAEAENLSARISYATAMHGEIAKVLEKTDIGRQNGLDIQTSFFQYGPPQIEALASKNVDVAFTSVVPTANFLARLPNAVKVIAYLGTSAHGLVVPENSSLKSLADLKSKSIAVAFGTDSYADLLVSLQAAGLNPQTDVKLVNVPPIEQPAALEQKLTDGVVLRQPLLYKYDHKGAHEIQRWPHQLWVIARSEYLAQNPAAEQRIVDAIRQAVLFVVQNSRQSAEWFAQTLRQDPALVEAVAAENPLFTNVSKLEDISLEPSPELKAFAAKRANELVHFGLSKTVATFVYP